MKVAELADKAQVDEITLEITEVEDPRDTSYGPVQNATGKDATGEVQISLWRDDVGKYAVGDTIQITSGWSKMYRDQMQVSSGKFGKIEKVE
jgi:ssDNA-binding replication factor A large subunit